MVLMNDDSKPLNILIPTFLSWVGCGYCCCGVSFVKGRKGKGVTDRLNEEKGLIS
jgi:hypothetical protein